MTARKLTEYELDAILAARRASARKAMQGRAHRALPLDQVEAKARAERKPWAGCSGTCSQGRSACNCPTTGASAVSGIDDEPPYNVRPIVRIPRRRPTYTWAAVTVLAIWAALIWALKP